MLASQTLDFSFADKCARRRLPPHVTVERKRYAQQGFYAQAWIPQFNRESLANRVLTDETFRARNQMRLLDLHCRKRREKCHPHCLKTLKRQMDWTGKFRAPPLPGPSPIRSLA